MVTYTMRDALGVQRVWGTGETHKDAILLCEIEAVAYRRNRPDVRLRPPMELRGICGNCDQMCDRCACLADAGI